MGNLLSKNEVDALMHAISVGQIPKSKRKSTKVALNEKARVYDFRHPAVFVHGHLHSIQTVHETFAMNFSCTLAAYLRTSVKARCMSVEQASFGEFLERLPDPCVAANVALKPSQCRCVLAIDSTLAIGTVDRVMGGGGAASPVKKPYTEIEQIVIGELVDLAIHDLEPVWARLLKSSFALESIEFSSQFIKAASPEDAVVTVAIEVAFGETQGMLSFCYPFQAMQPVIDCIKAKPHSVEEPKPQTTKNRTSMNAFVSQVPLKLSAHLGTTQITMRDLLQIKQGDVLMLDRAINRPIELEAGGHAKFLGHLGTCNGHSAMVIEQRIE